MPETEDEPLTPNKMLEEIRGRLVILENSLPKQIDPIAISRVKLPFKVLNYREALIWRMAELSRAALQTFDAKQMAAAIVLTRAAVETYAALWYLHEKVGIALKEKKLGDIDDRVDRLLSGTYTWDDFPDPIRVGKFVERVECRLPGFQEQYNRLSEYAHPNGAGITHLYSTIDHENILINFGPDSRQIEAAKTLCISNLNVALMLFEDTCNEFAERLPQFVGLCEKEIPPQVGAVSA